jgi:hypothetical protein
MLGIGRIAIVLMVGLTVVYVCMFYYLRSGARMRLEEEWAAEGRPGDAETWVDERIERAAGRIRVWLAICVYVIPLVALFAFVWLTN